MSREYRGANALLALNLLMHTDGYISAAELAEKCNCNRKTIYRNMDTLEISGFGIDMKKGKSPHGQINCYKYIGLHGF